MKILSFVFVLLHVCAAIVPAANITEGKSVTVQGIFGTLRSGSPWEPGGALAPASAVVDGEFRPEGTSWTDDAVWWDDDTSVQTSPAYIEIDLAGLYNVDLVLIQADSNDEYAIEYRNSGGVWIGAGAFPAVIPGSGLFTRGPFNVGPWEATGFRIYGLNGDRYHAVSEFQAFGSAAIPEPGTTALVALTLLGLLNFRRHLAP